MKLGDAVAAGYEKAAGWTTYKLQDQHGYACALGLAALGLGYANGIQARGMVFPGRSMEECAELWTAVVRLNNDECASYEDLMLGLKERGLADVEVERGRTPAWLDAVVS